jgi:hypothetical protein
MGLAGDQGQHSAVLCPTKDHDGHPNLIVSVEDRDYIAACSPERVLALLARVRSLENVLRLAITRTHPNTTLGRASRAALADEADK